MKKVLYFFPENPLEKNAGNKTRVLQLLNYFRKREFEVDFVSIGPWASKWSEKDVAAFLDSNLVSDVHILTQKPSRKNLLKYLFTYKISQLDYQKKTVWPKSAVHINSNYHTQRAFEQLLRVKHYDFILVSYVYWYYLISNKALTASSKTIIDTHDFITAQLVNTPDGTLGATFEDEMRRLALFDEIWAISIDEEYLFSQFCSNTVRWVPMMLNAPETRPEDQLSDKTYDLIYVASDNEYNQVSARWFFEEVYPILPKQLRLCIIGGITQYIGDYENVTKISFAENLDDYYRHSKIALCPMFRGTGVKIKVIEALSYGLPVVCTRRGIDGLPNKSNNGCLVSDEAGIFAQNIISLLENHQLYNEQSKFAKALFDRHFSLEECYHILDKAFDL